MSLSTILQERGLASLLENSGFKFSDTFFIYTSGKIGPYYINSEVVTKNENSYADTVNNISVLISLMVGDDNYDVISGGESRDWIFSYPVAFHSRKKHVSLYKDGKIIGADLEGKRVVHVCDLNNEGSSPRDLWIPIIRNSGGRIDNIFFFVDRLEDGVGVMRELGLERYAVVELNENAWNKLLKWNVINEEVYKSLRKRMEDKEEWAKSILTSDKGIKKIIEYIEAPKTKKRVFNMINRGYPWLKDYIINRLSGEGLDIVMLENDI